MILYYELAGKRSAYVPRLIRSTESGVYLKGLMPLRPGLTVEVAGPFNSTLPGRTSRSQGRVVACRCGRDGLYDIQVQLEVV